MRDCLFGALRNIAYLHTIHRLIVIDELRKTLDPAQNSNTNHNKHPTTRTKANHGETTEGGINVRTTGGIITVKLSIIARKPALV
jgi:hypothetical protein